MTAKTKSKKNGGSPNSQRAFIGEFTLDPRARDFRDLQSVCEKGNPWRCLIATSGSVHLGRRMTVRVDHERGTGIIGVTEGDYRWERPMTPEEVNFATRFDLNEKLPGPLTVSVDLRDPAWAARAKRETRGGPKTAANRYGAASQPGKSVRARQLAAIRAGGLPGQG